MRNDGRDNTSLRPIEVEVGFQKFADGSALVRWGDTHVLCAATIENKLPPWRNEADGGWVTSDYSMLPGSTQPRKSRRVGGRETEIKRLIGRSLRAAVDMRALGPKTVTVDCDVLQADGGTRVASITGGWIALAIALQQLKPDAQTSPHTVRAVERPVAAVSVGIVDGEIRLDLPYEEDSRAEVDMNVVMGAGEQIVEVQGTAEQGTFSRQQFDALVDCATQGLGRLWDFQLRAVAAASDDPKATVTL